MKTSDRLITLALVLAAPAARWLELKTQLDADGLPTGGVPYFVLLLAAAASIFLYSVRRLPARDTVTADLGGIFRFDSQLALTAAVMGALLLIVSAALRSVYYGGSSLGVLLSIFLCLSAAALLYVIFSVRRGQEPLPVTLLVPVCALVAQLIVTYRDNARESVLLRFYVVILLLAALCLAALYLAAFAYRCGSPRSFSLMAHLSLVLLAAECADLVLARRVDALAACLGALALLLAFLEAAGDFEG